MSYSSQKAPRKPNSHLLKPLLLTSAPNLPSEALVKPQDVGAPEDTISIIRRKKGGKKKKRKPLQESDVPFPDDPFDAALGVI